MKQGCMSPFSSQRSDLKLRRTQRFQDLMRHRVRDVLLVSSLYDAYILQEDGHLTEKVYVEYRELKLSTAPRFSHAGSAEAALAALEARRFDLVLVVSRLQGMSVPEFAEEVRQRHPSVAVVLLTFDSADHEPLRQLRNDPAIDGVFAWNGDARILLALSKTVEDARNVDHDIEVAGVRVILLVEDSIRFYSSYLSTLYPELMMQSQSLFSEGTNRLQKLLRMRTRPKVLLAQDFEQACLLVDRYREHLLAIISDVGFPKGGELDPQAGLELVGRVRRVMPDLPILLQSAEADYKDAEQRLRVQFVNKSSPRLLHQIRRFLRDYLGFGPFIFRTPEGHELRRARDMEELATCIEQVPTESLEYHGLRNHFSTWLMARSEFDLAELMRPQKVSDFSSIEELRSSTVAAIRRHARGLRSGVITDFSTLGFREDSALQRVGKGSLGGKARSIAFLDHLLSLRSDLVEREGLAVRIPQCFVLATNLFDEFLQQNDLYSLASSERPDGEIAERFLEASLPDSLLASLGTICRHVRSPLAVRPSTLLEDDLLHPFTGIYETTFLPNQDPDPARRVRELDQAVKLLYASTFFRRARLHLDAMGRSIEEEKMAILVQQLVGHASGDFYAPFCSGLARSHNFYALPPQRPSEGLVLFAYGLSSAAPADEAAVLVSPAHVHLLPQYRSPAERARLGSRSFLALDFRGHFALQGARQAPVVRRLPLEAAQADPFIPLAVGRHFPGARALVSGFDGPGQRLVTFEGLLHRPELPIAESLRALLSLAAAGMGRAVELEFALELDGDPESELTGTLFPLRLRPIMKRGSQEEGDEEPCAGELLCQTPFALGHSPPEALRDLVVVKPGAADKDPEGAAREIGELNERLTREGRPYVLVGPGRWGDRERGGIPVRWDQISGALLLVEIWPAGSAEPPMGAGFFDQVAQSGRGYLVIPPGASREEVPRGPFWRWKLLDDHPALVEGATTRHLRLRGTLTARINDPAKGGELTLTSGPTGPDAP